MGSLSRRGVPHNTDGDRSWSEPVALAQELLASGITMMKIQMGPKIAAWKNSAEGRRNTTSALPETFMDELVAPIKAIRTALGSSMEVACDWHHRTTATAPSHLLPPASVCLS